MYSKLGIISDDIANLRERIKLCRDEEKLKKMRYELKQLLDIRSTYMLYA